MRFYHRLLCVLLLLSLAVTALCACGKSDADLPVVRDLRWAVGGALPRAEDFFESIPEGGSARFAEEYRFSALGEYTLTLIYEDARGRETQYTANMTLALDTTPPVIDGAGDISVQLGEGISYRSGVSVRDDFDGHLTLEVDSSQVQATQAGSYPVIYTARDHAGNVTTKTVMVWIYQETVTEDMLWREIDALIAAYVSQSASREQQARDVYAYVHERIRYDAYSDKSDWVRAAYEGLRAGAGDCYTYFAISKAFFVRLGIDNMDVKRTEGIVTERHYWNLINIGTKEAPRWYHFDACRLNGVQHSGCLLTDQQLHAYTAKRVDEAGVGNYFYAFDTTAYPPTDTKIITATPSLEPYN